MDKDILLVLLGAGIALVSSVITIIIQHFFSLRAELKKLEYIEAQKRREHYENHY